jgi:hypothetical protein
VDLEEQFVRVIASLTTDLEDQIVIVIASLIADLEDQIVIVIVSSRTRPQTLHKVSYT